MPQHKEMSRFSASGKTFFFNKGEARNGTDYLAVNAIYGKGNQERIVLFPAHYLEFKKHLDEALTELTGFQMVGEREGTLGVPSLPRVCPECELSPRDWDVVIFSEPDWHIVCHCGNIMYTTERSNSNGTGQAG